MFFQEMDTREENETSDFVAKVLYQGYERARDDIDIETGLKDFDEGLENDEEAIMVLKTMLHAQAVVQGSSAFKSVTKSIQGLFEMEDMDLDMEMDM